MGSAQVHVGQPEPLDPKYPHVFGCNSFTQLLNKWKLMLSACDVYRGSSMRETGSQSIFQGRDSQQTKYIISKESKTVRGNLEQRLWVTRGMGLHVSVLIG